MRTVYFIMFEQLTFLLLKLHFGYVRKCFVEFGVSGREVCGPPSKGSGKRVSVCACERSRAGVFVSCVHMCVCCACGARVCGVCDPRAPPPQRVQCGPAGQRQPACASVFLNISSQHPFPSVAGRAQRANSFTIQVKTNSLGGTS